MKKKRKKTVMISIEKVSNIDKIIILLVNGENGDDNDDDDDDDTTISNNKLIFRVNKCNTMLLACRGHWPIIIIGTINIYIYTTLTSKWPA